MLADKNPRFKSAVGKWNVGDDWVSGHSWQQLNFDGC
jgi:hypothetical protein